MKFILTLESCKLDPRFGQNLETKMFQIPDVLAHSGLSENYSASAMIGCNEDQDRCFTILELIQLPSLTGLNLCIRC